MYTNVNLTQIITMPISILFGWLNDFEFTLFGITFSFGEWWKMCYLFGVLVFFLNWLAGGGLIRIGRLGHAMGVKGD